MDQINWVSLLNSLVQFGSLGLPGWIAAGVLVLIFGAGAFFLNRYLNKIKIEAANKETKEDRVKNLGDIAEKGRQVEVDSNKAEKEIADKLKGGK